MLAPRNVPKPILEKISKDWAEALKSPELQDKLKKQFLVGVSDTPEAMDKIVKSETENLTKVFKEAGI
jgi:tripartite-type tricarboxylate transporter receptor subunit TctC